MRSTSARLANGILLCLAFVLAGCGARQYDVTGKVTYNGRPLAYDAAPFQKPTGQVVFIGPDGRQVAAAIDHDGGYRATNVSAGANKVVIYYTNRRVTNKKSVRPNSGEALAGAEPPVRTARKSAVPDTSQLSVTVENDTAFDIKLKGPPR